MVYTLGYSPFMVKEKRNAPFHIRFTPQELSLLQALAVRTGTTAAGVIRALILREVRRTKVAS